MVAWSCNTFAHQIFSLELDSRKIDNPEIVGARELLRTRIREVLCFPVRPRDCRLCLLVFSQGDHLSAGCSDRRRAKSDHATERYGGIFVRRISPKTARCFFHRRACLASKEVSLRQRSGTRAGRSRAWLGTNVGPARSQPAQHHAKHALLLV